jgi:hypothetical protein
LAAAEFGGFRLETESLVARCDDFLADSPLPSDAADIGHGEARYAWNVRAHMPAVGAREERSVARLLDMVDPLILRLELRLHQLENLIRRKRRCLCGFAWNQSDDNVGVQHGGDATK